jgi:hypothetical protein
MEINMKKYSIPETNGDLKKYAKWKNTRRLLYYLLYVVFFAAAFLYYVSNRYENAEPLRWWVYPVYFVAVTVSGWFICLMNRNLRDKSFLGTIKSMNFSRNFDRGLSRKAEMSLDDHTYIKLTAVDELGKTRKVRIQLFDDGYDGYYKEGGEIVNFRGLNYPLCLDSEAEGMHLCAVCGVRTNYVEGRTVHGESVPEFRDGTMICRSCGHTMIGTRLKGGDVK